MAILKLPNEMLGHIMEETIPEGFENFMVTCKHFYAIGKRRIAVHNENRRKFQNLVYMPHGSTQETVYRMAAEFLLDVSRDPTIPLYIINADLRRDGDFFPTVHETVSEEWKKKLEDGDSQKSLRALVHASSFLKEAGEDPEYWFQKICLNKVDCLYASTFVLTLLLNVSTLRLPDKWNIQNLSSISEVRKVFDLIPIKAARTRIGGPGSPLVVLEYLGPISHFTRIDMIASLLKLPTIRRFDGFKITGGASRGNRRSAEPMQLSRSLTSVSMRRCHLELNELLGFLRLVPNLNEFHVTFDRIAGHSVPNWHKGRLIERLVSMHGIRLREFSMKQDNCRSAQDHILNFSQLNFLTDLSLSINLLWAKHQSYNGQAPISQPRDGWISRIADVIPRSIQKITLLVHRPDVAVHLLSEFMTAILQDFRISLRQKLPLLEYISLESTGPQVPEDEIEHGVGSIQHIMGKNGDSYIMWFNGIPFVSRSVHGPYIWRRAYN